MRFFILLLTLAALCSGQTKLLRFPDLHGDAVVFCYAGDLWKVSDQGGTATRLTSHPGLELFPKISPDGKTVAFTGQYDGDEQVYVIPLEGGAPEQLTYYPARGPLPPRWGFDHQVYGWSPDSTRVLFRSGREYWGPASGRLYTVSVDGGLPQPLAMPVSGVGDFSPDGKQVVYSPLFRDFRTWKRYAGGWAQDLYIFYPGTNETKQITDHPRTDRDPMWLGESIYFASDRDGTLNLYRYDLDSGKTRRETNSKHWDVRWPSSDGDSRIVYELNGELEIFDVSSRKTRPLRITAPDDGVHRRPRRADGSKSISEYDLSPGGERALFVARGDVFTAPIEKGPTRNLTRSSDAQEREASWSPDGKSVAYISDASGEEELYVIAQDGTGAAQQLTSDGGRKRYRPVWSPDSKKIAFSDKRGKLWVVNIADKQLVEVVDEIRGPIGRTVWSPDSRWLAFALTATERTRALHIWSADDGKTQRVTGEMFDEYQPTWDPDGKFLYYLSDRTFAPQISNVEWNFAGNRSTGVFALALRKDVPHPFPPESDEVKLSDDEAKKAAEDKDEKQASEDGESEGDESPSKIEIDFDGLAERAARVPIEADNLTGLRAAKGHLLYVKGTAFYYGRSPGAKPSVNIFSIKERKSEALVEGAQGYALSHDGAKVLVAQEGKYARYDAKLKGKDSKKDVATKGLALDIVPAQEWREMFGEVWRRFRDFFYVANMHGYDWAALRGQYEPWLEHVGHRSDLNYVIGEMIAELNVGHAYIAGGDFEAPERPKVALPGAELELDASAGRYRIARILRGQNEESIYRAPLTEVGVDITEGDYLLAIDGEELEPSDNPYRLLRNKADRPVEFTVNDKPTAEGSRKVKYRPVSNESNLRYLNWVTGNRRKVEQASDGRLGYLHIPDMGASGIREFIKYFYPQLGKQGLVIDVRGNGGGNVSQMVLERLNRKLLGTWFRRDDETTDTYPGSVFPGHLVCLISENSASDGDIFPARFKKAGLGPLIGKRSWGGVIGITNHGNLIDGGQVYVPEFATADDDGAWIIEGHGVEPDIEVDFPPDAEIAGRDPQLERGIAELERMIREDPRTLPSRPPAPVKTAR